MAIFNTDITSNTKKQREKTLNLFQRLCSHTIPNLRKAEKNKELEFTLSRFFGDYGCGTSYCILGYAGIDPWFIERGMAMVEGSMQFKGKRLKWACGPDAFRRVAKFFGITPVDVECLFYPQGYTNSGQKLPTVSNRINAFRRRLEKQHAKA